MKIFKYDIYPKSLIELPMPEGAIFLSSSQQLEDEQGKFQTWWLVDPSATGNTVRQFKVVGTGHEFDSNGLSFLSTTVCNGGTLVWHLFEINCH